ncbi:alcohol dehydrogenase catalytic domain-containing protein [Falsiroseomonas oryzae]|uniref:alcohol dehydrogenase catalytic domain-containing protein n=1 Tax=Falsiroseomonas oryzae TaxID=2766473 RepID=UPI0022EB990C|nr:alcohol dehydrogenase catalytic domain-containing protein [Roseomonas sp. MO-31]
MRAARFVGENRIAVDDAPPPLPKPGEVLLRVACCALCGSDLRPLRQGSPVTPGHEILGYVDQPGHAWHGRRALVYIPVFCGACPDCAAGHTHLCRNATDLMGWQRDGGYAEALAVPEQCLLPVPDDIPDHLAPLLLDAIGTTAHGVRLAQRIVPHGAALVLGAGPIGLGALLVLRGMGYGPLFAVEPGAYRARFAASLGAAHLAAEDAAMRRFDLVVEASGKDAARQMAFEVVAPMGAILQFGESDSWTIAENKTIRRKDFCLLRSFYFPVGDHAANIALLRAHRAEYERLVDDRAGFDGLQGLFDAFRRGEKLKPLFVP